MIEAVGENHFQIEIGSLARDEVHVEIVAVFASGVAKLDAVKEFHGENARGRQFGVGGRNMDFRMTGQVACKTFDVAAFAGEVEFAAERPLELGHDCPRPIGDELRNALGQHRQPGQDFQINSHAFLDLGVLYFYRHRLPRVEHGVMHLADRGAGQGRVVELLERFVDRASQFACDGGSHNDGRIVTYGGLQMFQLFSHSDSDQVGPGAEDLAQFDERGPQFRQGQPDARFARQPASPSPDRSRKTVLANSNSKRLSQSANPYLLRIEKISQERLTWR